MQPLSLILLSKNNESSQELQDALAGSTRVRILATCENADQMLADIIRLCPSAAVIILEAENTDKEFLLIKKLVAASPGTAIITAARDASPSLILGSMRSGAREFLQIPIIEDELQTVLDSTAEFCSANDNSSRKAGRVIAVFSGKGGAGVSFFATNLAAAMNLPTLLADLNLQAEMRHPFSGSRLGTPSQTS